MIVQKKIGLAKILLCILAIVILPCLLGNNKTNSLQATQDSVDTLSIKHREMLAPTVRVETYKSIGSGTIIHRTGTSDPAIFRYLVLTSAHVVRTRLIERIIGVDSLTGKKKSRTIDTGCSVTIFNHSTRNSKIIATTILAEDVCIDLTLLLFDFDSILPVAKIADASMLDQIRVFDEVFAIGCQLGLTPIPTVGIISGILSATSDVECPVNSIVYRSTTNMAYGSSGGGLFKLYDDHYYLIGVPGKLAFSKGRVVSHLAYSVSALTAKKFIDEKKIDLP